MAILDTFRLDGRRALVTGGTRGLGLEMARGLAEAGAEVVLVGREAEHLQAAVAAMASIGSKDPTLQADLASGEETERMCAAALELFSPIDIVVNHVGGRQINNPTEEMPLDEWRRILDLNLTQAFICTKI